jgi:hypothetical protein
LSCASLADAIMPAKVPPARLLDRKQHRKQDAPATRAGTSINGADESDFMAKDACARLPVRPAGTEGEPRRAGSSPPGREHHEAVHRDDGAAAVGFAPSGDHRHDGVGDSAEDVLDLPDFLDRNRREKAIVAAFKNTVEQVYGVRPCPVAGGIATARGWLKNGAATVSWPAVLCSAIEQRKERGDDSPQSLADLDDEVTAALVCPDGGHRVGEASLTGERDSSAASAYSSL